MAKFNLELPTEELNEFKRIYDNADEIFAEMTKAGAEVVLDNVKASAPKNLGNYAKLTRSYRTPTNGGINTKVIISGYIPFKGNRTSFSRRGRKGSDVYTTTQGIPADFLANVFEYGRRGAPFPKRPFFRKAFKKAQITAKMLEAQKKASGGLLE